MRNLWNKRSSKNEFAWLTTISRHMWLDHMWIECNMSCCACAHNAIRCCFFFIPALISSPLLHNKIKKHKSSYIELHMHDHSSLVNWLFIVCARCCCVDLSRPDRGIGSLLCHRRAHKWMAIFISQFVTQSISFANCVSNCDVRV